MTGFQVYVNDKPRSLTEHVGTGRHYNINSKSGLMQILFSEERSRNDIYNTDIAAYLTNMECIDQMHHPYVVITPNYMVYTCNYEDLIEQHVDFGRGYYAAVPSGGQCERPLSELQDPQSQQTEGRSVDRE